MFMQLLDGVLVALAVLVSAAIAVSLAMLAASPSPGSASRRTAESGPTRPQHPQPDTDHARTLVSTDRSHPRHADSCPHGALRVTARP